MGRIAIKLPNVHFNNPGLPVISATDREKQINQLPGLRFWLDPQSRFEPFGGLGGIRDRKGLMNSTPNPAGVPFYALTSAINSQPTIDFTTGTDQGLIFADASPLSFMSAGYSIMIVVKRSGSGAFLPLHIASLKLAMALQSGGISVIHGGVNAGTGSSVLDTNPHIVLLGWDPTTHAVGVYVDNAPIAVTDFIGATAPDLTGLTYMVIGSPVALAITQSVTLGTMLVFDRNYTRGELAGPRAALFNLMHSKYNITLAA